MVVFIMTSDSSEAGDLLIIEIESLVGLSAVGCVEVVPKGWIEGVEEI